MTERGAGPPRRLPPLAPAVYRHRLPNGVTLLVLPTGAPAAAVVVRVMAGFLDEADAQVGLSHVLEHLIFKGAPELGPGDLARRIKAAGGYVNAFTSYDATQYWAVLPPDGVPEAARLLAGSVCAPTVDPEELQRELGVIAEEIRRKRDTPPAMAQETLHQLLFDRHRIRRWRIGQEEAVTAFTREAVLGFHAGHYVPERTIVCVAGGVEAEPTLDLLEHVWGDWHRAGAARNTGPAEVEEPGVRAGWLTGDTAAVEWRVGWRAPGPLHDDTDALGLGATVLGLGRGSRLWGALRTPGLATTVTAGYVGAHDVGVLALGATAGAGEFPAVPQALAAEVAALRERGPSADELQRARNLLLSRHAGMRESMEALAGALAGAEALRDIALLDEELDRLERLTASDVQDAAARWLAPGQVCAVGHGPGGTAGLEVDALVEAFAAPGSRRPGPALPVLTEAPATASAGGTGPQRVELNRGQLLCWPRGGGGLVFVGCYVPRPWPDPPGQAGLGMLALRSALRGAGNLDEAQLALAIERLGGTLGPSGGHDVVGFGATVLASHVADVTACLQALLDSPAFDSGQVLHERTALQAEAAQARDDMWRWPQRLALGAALGDTGYGLSAGGTEDSLASLDAEAVRAWHTATFSRPRTVVMAGDVDPDQAARLAEQLTGPSSEAPAPTLPASTWGAWHEGAERVELRERHQTALALVFPGPDRRSDARHAAEVWAALAGGLGGRLFESLRSARSLAYTVHAGATTWRHAGALVTYLATSPEREEEALASLHEELAGFRAAPPTEEETTRATRYLAGQLRVGRQRTAALAAELLDAGLLGTGLDELRAPWEAILSVTPGDVHRTCAALDPARAALGMVRGRVG